MVTINTGLFQPAYINIAVVILFVIFMVRGAKRGVLMQVLSAFGTVVSFLAAWRYCTFASGYYNLWPKSIVPMNEIPGVGDTVYSRLNNLIWFIALFIVIRLLFIILEKLCSGLSGLPVLKEISGLLGGILGIVSATIWIMVICVVLNMPFFKNGKGCRAVPDRNDYQCGLQNNHRICRSDQCLRNNRRSLSGSYGIR